MTGYAGRYSPVAHLATVFLWIIPVLLSFDPYTPLLFLGLCLVHLFALGRVSIGKFFSVVLPLMMLPVGLFLLNLLFTDVSGHPAVVVVLGVRIHRYAAYRAAIVAVRSTALITISVSYLLVTDPLDLVNALMQQLRLSVRFGYSLFVAWNTVPRLLDDYRRIRQTHLIRRRGRPRHVRELLPTAITLLAGAIRHAQRAAVSMGVRGIEEVENRTFLYRSVWQRRDTAYLGVNAVVVTVLFALAIRGGWFVFGLG